MIPSNRLLALSGLLAPLFYVAATVLTVWLRPGYSLSLETVSQLADVDAPFGLLFVLAGAVPVGVLTFVFAYAVWCALPEEGDAPGMLYGIVLLAQEGIWLVLAFGLFARSGPEPGAVHIGMGLLALACGVAGRLLLARPLGHLGRFYPPFTRVVAIAIPVLFLGAAQLTSTPGLYERIAHALAFLWMMAVAVSIIFQRPEEISAG